MEDAHKAEHRERMSKSASTARGFPPALRVSDPTYRYGSARLRAKTESPTCDRRSSRCSTLLWFAGWLVARPRFGIARGRQARRARSARTSDGNRCAQGRSPRDKMARLPGARNAGPNARRLRQLAGSRVLDASITFYVSKQSHNNVKRHGQRESRKSLGVRHAKKPPINGGVVASPALCSSRRTNEATESTRDRRGR